MIKESTEGATLPFFICSKVYQNLSVVLLSHGWVFCYVHYRKGGDFFDYSGIYQVKRKVRLDAVCNDLCGDYGIDK